VGACLPDEALGYEGLGAVLQGEEREVERHPTPARRRRRRRRLGGRGAHPPSAALARFRSKAPKCAPRPALRTTAPALSFPYRARFTRLSPVFFFVCVLVFDWIRFDSEAGTGSTSEGGGAFRVHERTRTT